MKREAAGTNFGGRPIEYTLLDKEIAYSSGAENLIFSSQEEFDCAIKDILAEKKALDKLIRKRHFNLILVDASNQVQQTVRIEPRHVSKKKSSIDAGGAYTLSGRRVFAHSVEERDRIESDLWAEVSALPDTDEGNNFAYMLCTVDPLYGVVERRRIYRQGSSALTSGSTEKRKSKIEATDAERTRALQIAGPKINALSEQFRSEGVLNIEHRRGYLLRMRPNKAYRVAAERGKGTGEYVIPFTFQRRIQPQPGVIASTAEWEDAMGAAKESLDGVIDEQVRQSIAHAERGEGLETVIELQKPYREPSSNRLKIPIDLKNGIDSDE